MKKAKPVEARRVREMLAEFRRCRHASRCSGCMERLTEIERVFASMVSAAELRELRRVFRAAVKWAKEPGDTGYKRQAAKELCRALSRSKRKGRQTK